MRFRIRYKHRMSHRCLTLKGGYKTREEAEEAMARVKPRHPDAKLWVCEAAKRPSRSG